MKYEDIPKKLRIKRFKTSLDEKDVDRLHERIKLCRDYLNSLSEGLADILI
jgi:hypothetical protein